MTKKQAREISTAITALCTWQQMYFNTPVHSHDFELCKKAYCDSLADLRALGIPMPIAASERLLIMKNTSHTPGPWYPSDTWAGKNKMEIISGPQCVPVAVIPLDLYDEGDLDQIDQAQANARLIAAAPELLESLIKLTAFVDGCHSDGLIDMPENADEYLLAVAAIAKATGE